MFASALPLILYICVVPLGGLLAAQHGCFNQSERHCGRPCETQRHARFTRTLKAGTYWLSVRLEWPPPTDILQYACLHSHTLVSRLSTARDTSVIQRAGAITQLSPHRIYDLHVQSELSIVCMQKTMYFFKAGTHRNTQPAHQSPSPNLLQKAALSSLHQVPHQN